MLEIYSHLTTIFKILIIILFAFLCDLSQYISFHKHIFIHKTLLLTAVDFDVAWNEIYYLKYNQTHTQKNKPKNSVKKSPTWLFVALTAKDTEF